ncbi:MAG: 6,7-dimethyl-8-ribityllumazine synthase [Opitutaceae bacterium]|nr:6,7-dimethyl-8-ribityllumazine synthase [Opitutaceae bacterium]
MSLSAPTPSTIDGSAFQVGIVAACYNEKLVNGLLVRVLESLHAAGVIEENIRVVRVPGSHEAPWAASELGRRPGTDVVIALGVLIGGDTNHHEMVGQSVSHALQTASLFNRVPVINGVIVTDTLAQAKARTIGRIDRGAEFAHAALAMAALKKKLSS